MIDPDTIVNVSVAVVLVACAIMLFWKTLS